LLQLGEVAKGIFKKMFEVDSGEQMVHLTEVLERF
jgi:hypothetical protein